MVNNNNDNKCVSAKEVMTHLDKVVFCRKHNGKEFMARLVKIEGNDLTFLTKRGNLVLNLRETISYMTEL